MTDCRHDGNIYCNVCAEVHIVISTQGWLHPCHDSGDQTASIFTELCVLRLRVAAETSNTLLGHKIR
jgi:hypothetical protein